MTESHHKTAKIWPHLSWTEKKWFTATTTGHSEATSAHHIYLWVFLSPPLFCWTQSLLLLQPDLKDAKSESGSSPEALNENICTVGSDLFLNSHIKFFLLWWKWEKQVFTAALQELLVMPQDLLDIFRSSLSTTWTLSKKQVTWCERSGQGHTQQDSLTSSTFLRCFTDEARQQN